MDDPIWDPTVFTKNRDRLFQGDIAQALITAGLTLARQVNLVSAERFTVDGTLLDAWASHKSVKPQAAQVVGAAEPVTALALTTAIPGEHRATLGNDKGYDTADFVTGCRDLRITPHVARTSTGAAGAPSTAEPRAIPGTR